MDVTLPGIDGLEATRRIRALAGAASRTPIVGISGRTENGDERRREQPAWTLICASRSARAR